MNIKDVIAQAEKEEFEKLIDLYVAPNRRDIVKQCVLGNAEYQGTVRINASAIPLFRNFNSAFRSYTKDLLQSVVEEMKSKAKFRRISDPDTDKVEVRQIILLSDFQDIINN